MDLLCVVGARPTKCENSPNPYTGVTSSPFTCSTPIATYTTVSMACGQVESRLEKDRSFMQRVGPARQIAS